MDQRLIDMAAMLVLLHEEGCLNTKGKQLLIDVAAEVKRQREGQYANGEQSVSKTDTT